MYEAIVCVPVPDFFYSPLFLTFVCCWGGEEGKGGGKADRLSLSLSLSLFGRRRKWRKEEEEKS